MSDDKKSGQPARTDEQQDKIPELPPKSVSDADAQSVKGGATTTRKDAL